RAIIEKLPEQIEKVGVFANASAEQVRVVAADANVTAIQVFVDGLPFRRDGFEQVATAANLKLIPVLSMNQEHPEELAMAWDAGTVHAFLLDSSSSEKPGGTGCAFDWRAREHSARVIQTMGKVIVAGGLSVTNVSDAIRILRPWGVDVVSGVEARPGKKDANKVREFITAVRRSDEGIQ
ncbi:MAG: phosphoribosylanthranilate isomerase, partial [Acidobacteriaceae bacterium]|nr:phosphoribosylanthranilate isomerase [Acidobacteriaceae bacterium]